MRKTHETFLVEVFNLVGDKYTVLETYIGSKQKIKFKHEECGHVFSMRPNNFLGGQRCPSCFGTPKKTNEQFLKQVRKVDTNNEYEFIENYISTDVPILCLHKKCEHKWKIRPNKFLNYGQRCPKCAPKIWGEKGALTHAEFIKRASSYDDFGDFVFLDKYDRYDAKMRCKHLICGNIFLFTPHKFLLGRRCPHCAANRPKNTKMFSKEVNTLTNGEYEVLGEYVNSTTNIEILHKECGKSFSMTPSSFLTGSRCLMCKSSKGEKKIRDFLINNSIKFDSEVRFDDCRNKLPLPFDFGILNEDGDYFLLIEYDGIQHFKPTGRVTKDILKETQKRDEIKNKYCKDNGIPLLRIPYWDYDNIEEILKKEIANRVKHV